LHAEIERRFFGQRLAAQREHSAAVGKEDSMARPKFAFVAAGALVLTAMTVRTPVRPISVDAAPSIGFETPTVVDPIHTNGEPDIAVDKFGRVFDSGPTGTGTQRSTWFGSVDAGHTFRVMAQKVPP